MTEPEKTLSVVVSANALWRTAPLLASRDDTVFRQGWGRHLWGWYVEPHPDKGVLVIATDGRALGILHDPEGSTKEGCFIYATEGLLRGIAPPKKLTAYSEGDSWEVEPRAIEIPGKVLATSVGVFVMHSGEYSDGPDSDGENDFNLYQEQAEFGSTWAGGYRLIASPHGWRRVVDHFKRAKPVTPYLDPALLANFSRIHDGGWFIQTQEDEEGPYQVWAPEATDFAGYIMPCRIGARPGDARPEWLEKSYKLKPEPKTEAA